jgi:hypothetical protein
MKTVQRKAPSNKFSHVKGKLNLTAQKKGDQEFERLVQDLKTQVVSSHRKIIQMETQRDQL